MLNRATISAAMLLATATHAQVCTTSGWRRHFAEGGVGEVSPSVGVSAHAIVDTDGPGPLWPALAIIETNTQFGTTEFRVSAWNGLRWSPVGDALGPCTAGAGWGTWYQSLAAVTDPTTGVQTLYACGECAGPIIRAWNGFDWTTVVHFPSPYSRIASVVALDADGPGPGPELLVALVSTAQFGPVPYPDYFGSWDGQQWRWAHSAGWLVQDMTVLEEADHRKRLIYLETVQQEQIGGGYYYRSQVNAWDGVAPPIEIVSDSCSSPCVHTSWTVAPFRDADGLLEYFIGGSFESLGGVPARNVARWDGVSWHAADSGLSPGSFVRRLTATSISGSPTLYATRNLGSSTEYQAVIRWTGQSWSPPIATCNGTISTLVPFDDGQPSLFALGRFTSINGRRATNIARTLGPLESPVWAPVGQCPGDTVRALARIPEGSGTLAPGLYAAGSFTTAGTAIAPAVARWNGSQWSNLGLGVNSRIDSLTLATINGRVSLFAGGAFTGAGNELAPHIASWDGRIWTALGEGLSGDVLAMTPLAGDLIAAGRFTSSGAAPLAHIARWNGATWSPLSTGLNGEVRALAPVDSPPNATLYAAGDFTSAGGHAANRVARWNGKWSAMGDGFDGPVNALAFYDDGLGAYLVAAGEFEHSGSTAVSHIARWTGQSWVPMGQGVNGVVNSLAVFDPDGSGPALVRLAVGGSFTQADGQPAARLAQWVGSTWRPFEGQPDDGAVLSLCVADPDGAGEEPYSLFLGGSFTHIAGLSSPNIGQWGTCECYANCDHSTTIPTLTASDFQCFLNRFASADPYANCDGSTLPPTLSANDFQCFLNRFAAGCP